MAVGPVIMALGVLWYVRIPSTSSAWHLQLNDPSTIIPPLSYFIDFLPAGVLFGIGIMITVAPLTTAVMTSVPAHNSGLASAINNAISRVGPQLAGAVIFILITNSFYSGVAARKPGLDVTTSAFRQHVSPLNPSGIPGLNSIVRAASTDALHLAMLVVAALLLVGAVVNALGIQNRRQEPVISESKAAPCTPAGTLCEETA
jgi:hypothetical protein